MKALFYLFCLMIIITSCDTSIPKNSFCGKRFSSSTPISSESNFSHNTGTTLNCDGTFESGDITHSNSVMYNSVDRSHFTGTWQLITEIQENVKTAVEESGYGKENYSIIKYTSNNGVSGYCICYSFAGKIRLEPLFTGQISNYDWGNVSGAAGIFAGALED